VTKRTRHALIEFLLADDARAATAGRLLSGEFEEALALAQSWKVVPKFFTRVQVLGIEVNDRNLAALRREFLKSFGDSALRTTRAIEAIRSLENERIPVAIFKGVAAMAWLYGDPKYRTVQDVDIVVGERDLARTLDALACAGFTRQGSETLEQYLQFVENAPRFAGNKAITLFGAEGGEIDLHWDLAGSGLRTEEILSRSTTAMLMNRPIPVVDPADEFLLTVNHVVREDFGIQSVCRDLLDSRLWLEHLLKIGRLETSIEQVAQCGRQVPVLAVTSILCGYDNSGAAAKAAGVISAMTTAAEQQSASRLTELFQYQVDNGRLEKDLLYLVASRPWLQILRGLRTDWSGYRQSMQTIEQRTGEEMPLYARGAQLARSIPGIHGLRLARELARVKYGVSRRP
jgi:hypothetical protein